MTDLRVKLPKKLWVDIGNALTKLNETVKLTFHADSLVIRTVDPACVAMMEIVVHHSGIQVPTEQHVAVDMTKFAKAVACMNEGDVTMEVLPDSHRIVLSDGRMTRSLSPLDAEGLKTPQIPTFQWTSKWTVAVDDLRRYLQALKGVDSVMMFQSAGPDQPIILAGQDEEDTVEIDGGTNKWTTTEPVHVKLSLEYVEKLGRVAWGDIDIELKTNYPVQMTWGDPVMHTKVVVAPRIEV